MIIKWMLRIGIILIILQLALWFFFKPIRVVTPELNGLFCKEKNFCIDDVEHLDDAVALYNESLLFVKNNIGEITKEPRMIFCSTKSCSDSFGLGRRSAIQLPIGIVIGPRAWKRYYISHELIHQLQQQKFGALYYYKKPQWYLEGMAYLLSDDPRELLGGPLQGYRTEFQKWYESVGKENLWTEFEGK